MGDPHKKKPTGMCPRSYGPGPANYMLPTNVGYNLHDFTKYRDPAYSLYGRATDCKKWGTPGPKYLIKKYLTRFGPDGTPMYTMRPRYKDLCPFNSPGPAAYDGPKSARGPEYTLSGIPKDPCKFNGPAPNAYTLPGFPSPAYTMGMKLGSKTCAKTPAPNAYKITDLNIFKRRDPMYSMLARLPVKTCSPTPGPAAYFSQYREKDSSPEFSFGVKHSECITQCILPEDQC